MKHKHIHWTLTGIDETQIYTACWLVHKDYMNTTGLFEGIQNANSISRTGKRSLRCQGTLILLYTSELNWDSAATVSFSAVAASWKHRHLKYCCNNDNDNKTSNNSHDNTYKHNTDKQNSLFHNWLILLQRDPNMHAHVRKEQHEKHV